MKAVLLVRFSPRPNADKCESCDVQLESLRAWCLAQGHEVVAEFREDALSGDTAEERPTLTAALEACKKGMILVCRDFQRISRNARFLMYVAADMAGRGVTLHSLTEGKYEHDDDELFLSFGVRALFGEYTRRKIRKLTKRRMLEKQDDGERMSKELRYGKRYDESGPKNALGVPKRTLPDEGELAIIDRMMRLTGDGIGASGIARQLNEGTETEPAVTCRGRKWSRQTVDRIIKREKKSRA